MSARRRTPLPLLLLLVGLAGAALSYVLSSAPLDLGDEDPAAPPARPAGRQAAPPQAAFTLPPLGDYAEVGARPLFSPTRRPAPPDEAPAAERRMTEMVLTGVVMSPRERFAIVQYGTPPVLQRVSEGQEVQGWTVQTIHADHVVLKSGDLTQTVRFQDKLPPRPGQPAGRRPPAPTTPARPPGAPAPQAN
jgi:general secretion pathway protein N